MIKYNLECICGKMFESWFSGSKEYDLLKKKELINCIYCNSTSVKKTLMTPNLTGKANKISKEDKRERKLRKQLVEFRKYIEKNCKNVADKISQEARNIHYDKKTNKGIYVQATPEETLELLEEGIDVTTIPWVKKSDN